MIRIMTVALLVAALAACQPQKTPEQLEAERQAEALKQMGAMFGALAGGDPNAQVTPEQMAAALAQAGAMAETMDREMTAEDRAKLQAVTGAWQSGQVHPAASAWISGANQTLEILKGVKDTASANAAKAQLAPIYAAMEGPAATLEAMTEDQRDVAMGSALPQFMSFGMNAMNLMAPLSNDPALAEMVEDLLDEMPSPN